MAGIIHIGTSGWHYDHWRGPFYPEKLPSAEMLGWYSEHFWTVEINNSFYQLPSRKTFREWRRQTPAEFSFAVKASRYITHMKKLKEPGAALRKLLLHAGELKENLGPVLFQLPPRWRRNPERLAAFLKALPRKHRYVFEFRDASWFDEEIYALLRRHNAALCVYDLAGFASPVERTADFGYLRLHGPATEKYAGRYSRAQLRHWLKLCEAWLKQGAKQVYVYFDNDQAGFATLNAIEMFEMACEQGWQVKGTGARLRAGRRKRARRR
jgi:uncharacterized protein YecE (DUF72 family)